jgi:hypothetical protein
MEQCRQTFSSLTITRPVGEGPGDIETLAEVGRRGLEAGAEILLRAVGDKVDAAFRAGIDTGVAFDAQLGA